MEVQLLSRTKVLADYLKGHRIHILMYHSVSDDPLDPWTVSPQKFAIQINWLKAKGCNVISLNQALMDFQSGNIRAKSVVLTFDDGYVDFLENAVPILREYQYPATVFVIPGKTGCNSYWQSLKLQKPLLSWEGIKQIAKLGYQVASHGLNHLKLIELSFKDMETEITVSKNMLEDRIGLPVNAFSFPWGNHSEREIDVLQKAGYDCAVIAHCRLGNGRETNPFCLQRYGVSRSDSLNSFEYKVGNYKKCYVEARNILSLLVQRILAKYINSSEQ